MTTEASLARAFSCEPAATPDEIAAISAVLELANAGGEEASRDEQTDSTGSPGASRWRLAARLEATGRPESAGGARA
jgi:hypothetical protein